MLFLVNIMGNMLVANVGPLQWTKPHIIHAIWENHKTLTTIAATTTQIAADKQATHGGGMAFKMKTKLHKFDNGAFYKTPFYVGLAGNVDTFASILNYFEYPETYKRTPKLKGEGIILTADGKIWTFLSPNEWLLVDQPYYAIGSGMHFAMGAMANGKTAIEAVKTAAKLDPGTGMGFTTINL